jgi:hypothetical protein
VHFRSRTLSRTMDGKWFRSGTNVASYFIEKKAEEKEYELRRPKRYRPRWVYTFLIWG